MITLTDDIETNIEAIIMDSVEKSLNGPMDEEAMNEHNRNIEEIYPSKEFLDEFFGFEHPYVDYRENLSFVYMLQNYIDGRVEERPVTTTIIQRETRVLDTSARSYAGFADNNTLRKSRWLAIPALLFLLGPENPLSYGGLVSTFPAALHIARGISYLQDRHDIKHDKQVREILQTDQTLWDTTLAKIKPEIGQLLQERYAS